MGKRTIPTSADKSILLCTDLDRTLLPNGKQEESENARLRFRKLASRPDVVLVYVTGRDRQLLSQGLLEYDLPFPEYAITDVGTQIFQIKNAKWRMWDEWEEHLFCHWPAHTRTVIEPLLLEDKRMCLQELEKQNRFKISYYVSIDVDSVQLLSGIDSRLREQGIKVNMIWSVDELKQIGLLDLLPINATKRHAIEFLVKGKGFCVENTLFAGDSGNDLAVVGSSIKTILVANASDAVKQEALELSQRADQEENLYIATGNNVLGMNGNYSAGVLEGVVHYVPHALNWLE